jgi:hypothetical protein
MVKRPVSKSLKYYNLILEVMKITSKESSSNLDKIKHIDNLNHVILGFPIRIPHSLKLNWSGRTVIPNNFELRWKILDEAHHTWYNVHPRNNKMYQDLKKIFWWCGIKRVVAEYVAQCPLYQLVKVEHQRLVGQLQPLEVPMWKWDQIAMDFVVGLPKALSGQDVIWIIVDRLMKSAHFLPIKITDSLDKLTEMHVREIVRLHGVPVSIVSDCDLRFTSKIWERLHEAMGTKLNFSTAYHPQTVRQSERTIQTLEDMLRLCVLDFKGSWIRYLPLVQFAYNNSF